MNKDILTYNKSQTAADKKICDTLAAIIEENLTKSENKVWHEHPV